MRDTKRAKLIPTLVCLGALVLGAMPSQAHVAAFGSKITIGHRAGTFSGTVSSKRKGCKKARRVVVRKGRPNQSDILVGTDFTNAAGRWSVDRGGKTGDFYAVAKRRTRSRYGHSHKCRRAISRHIKVRRG